MFVLDDYIHRNTKPESYGDGYSYSDKILSGVSWQTSP